MGKTAEALAETGARSLWREVLLVLLTVLLCLLGGMFHADDTVGAPPLLAYVLAAVGAGIALARHRFAVWAWVAATGCAVLVPLEILLTPLVIAPLVLVSYTLISRGHRFGWWLVVAGALSALLAFTGAGSWEDSSRLGTVVAAPLMAGVLGRSARDRRAYLFSVQQRARRAEETRDSEARSKVAQERLRIARELHDLVAHQITLANAQAAVAERLFDTQPDKARVSLHELQQTTRHALDELRATVGLLREEDSPEPAPGLAQLAKLLASFEQLGVRVNLQTQGQPGALAASVDLAAYRIIQEALTNTAKHSQAKAAHVKLVWEARWLNLEISDPGPAKPQQRPGYGLIGMGERAQVAGGQFSAQAQGDGFIVSARLPLATAQLDRKK
ncbi:MULTISPECIES: sensor histidine kinase [Glutamicibacter]|uniref:sensor histidine kinase n=1 Tax=Glutamicibacter TaxID=1742989 RepID=UPI000EC74F20|nr:sensor histidine kinase [Glutamicibacter sp.]HCJ53517.1 two-component sensor histidine kinase [Glutamicibacter sp.]